MVTHTTGDDDGHSEPLGREGFPATTSQAEDQPGKDEAVSADDSLDRAEADTTTTTRPEGLIGSRDPAFLIVGRTCRDRFRALLTVSVLPTLPVAIAWWGFLLLLSRDGVVVNGIPTPWEWTSTPVLVTTGILGVASALVSALSLGAGIIISGAGILGRDVTPAAALRRAVRRVPAIVVWWLLVTLAAMAAFVFAGYVVARLEIESGATPLTVVIGLVSLIYFAWIAVALPVALLENKGLFRSLGAAWYMGLDQRGGLDPLQFPTGVAVEPRELT